MQQSLPWSARRRGGRAAGPLVTCLLGLLLGACSGRADLGLIDLSGAPADPFRDAAGKLLVFLFVRTECPISNRYAPEVRRLAEEFRGSAAFHLVYPVADEAPEAIRRHLAEYGYPQGALRDPRLGLARRAGATVTPEAALLDRDGRVLYHGRIDDRFIAFGKERAAPMTHDLEQAIIAARAGRPVTPQATSAVGCYIPGIR